MTTWITLCDTCKRSEPAAAPSGGTPVDGTTDGERLAALVEARVRVLVGSLPGNDGYADSPAVRTRRHSCLMGCTRACNVVIGASGKMSYTLGSLAPEPEAADALVDYACRHAASQTGVVPFRDWPAGVKGHFVTRHPPLP